MEKEFEKLGLKIYHKEYHGNSDDPDDYEPIDFSIDDGTDNVAWVWGSHPTNDVEVECNHPSEAIEWGDDDECGECKLCGATCDWHWEKEWLDEGHGEDGGCIGHEVQTRHIDKWYCPKRSKGLIGEYLKELQKKW